MMIAAEVPQIKAKIHWISFFGSALCAFVSTLFAFDHLLFSGDQSKMVVFLVTIFVGYFPLLLRYIQIKNRSYIIADPFLLVKEGLMTTSQKKVLIANINNIEVRQSFFEKLVNAGSLTIYAGNDQAISLENISDPAQFEQNLNPTNISINNIKK
jgi:uncharacterized membrane protein YdbT with pleckstrin-like domain